MYVLPARFGEPHLLICFTSSLLSLLSLHWCFILWILIILSHWLVIVYSRLTFSIPTFLHTKVIYKGSKTMSACCRELKKLCCDKGSWNNKSKLALSQSVIPAAFTLSPSDNIIQSSYSPQDSSVCPKLPASLQVPPALSRSDPPGWFPSLCACHSHLTETRGWLDLLERSCNNTDVDSEVPLAAFKLCEDNLTAPVDIAFCTPVAQKP